MANTIFSKPVDYPTAKILKDKGYDKISQNLWHFNGSDCIEMPNKNSENFGFSAPTIGEVLEWLYEKHRIWIRVTPIPYSDNLTHWRWEHISTNYSTRSLKWKKEQDYMSPTKAYEAAIEYCLTNLI
jgi:hypothetical protein